ncbi:MAG: gamma-glutamyltransferase [Pseudomonadota bacterium]
MKNDLDIVKFVTHVHRLHPTNFTSRLRVVQQLILGLVLAAASTSSLAQQSIHRYASLYHPAQSQHGMVVSQRHCASKIGAGVLSDGGNAIDAAVAVGFALAVNLPRAGNLGGGGFLLFYDKATGKTHSLDFRETAPAAASADMFLTSDGEIDSEKYRSSHLSVAVPGTVAGLLDAHRKYGRLPLKRLLAPAVQLAKQGVEVSHDFSSAVSSRTKMLTRHAGTRKKFFGDDGEAPVPGTLFKQPELASTIQQIADNGSEGFYQGKTADLIVAEMARGGGLITHADLEAYKPLWRDPVVGQYRGSRVVAMPPPSSGGVHVIQMLNILDQFPLADMGHNSANSLHLLAESMKIAYADRTVHLGDPDFYDVPQEWLTSKAYGKTSAKAISMNVARRAEDIAPGTPPHPESVDTTHFSVVDADGNAVAVTYTLNFSFGSGITVPGAGFLLNNEMTDFTPKAGAADAFGLITGSANEVAPLKRPLSAMTPAMVFKDGELMLVTGSPGGSRIINVVLQNIVNMIDFGMNVAEATNAPRVHHQWQPDKLNVERGISPDTLEILTSRGHVVTQSASLGSVQAISRQAGVLYGSADPRRPGAGAAPVVRKVGDSR